MKLTDDLKKKLEAAQTKEEAEAILAEIKGAAAQAGIELDSKDLEQIAGGSIIPRRGINIRTLPL